MFGGKKHDDPDQPRDKDGKFAEKPHLDASADTVDAALAGAAAEFDNPTPDDPDAIYQNNVARLRGAFEDVDSLPDDLVPITEKYEVLSTYARGTIDEAREHMPDPEAFFFYDPDADAMQFDAAGYEAEAKARVPSFLDTRQEALDTSRAWLNERSDDELDRIAVASGNPHFTTAPRDKKIVLLDQTIERERKAVYLNKAMEQWLGQGNHRYGPPGYTIDGEVQDSLNGHVDLDMDGQPRHFPPRFKELPADNLARIARALPEAHLGDRRHGAPSMRRFAELAESHPDLTFSGEVIGPIHPKESVRIKAVHIPDAKKDLPVFADMASGPNRKVTDEFGYRRILWLD